MLASCYSFRGLKGGLVDGSLVAIDPSLVRHEGFGEGWVEQGVGY